MSLPFMTLALLLPALSTCASATASSGLEPAQSAPAQSGPQAETKTSTIRVIIQGFRNHKGQALTSLYSSPKGFPDKVDAAVRQSARKIDADKIEVVFERVPVGSYAVAVLHDEDMDFKMKTGMFGIPKEGYGVSNNAKGRFGPPKYGDAKFKVTERDVELTISIIYY